MKLPPWMRRGSLATLGAAFGFTVFACAALLLHVVRGMRGAAAAIHHAATDEVVTGAYFATAAALVMAVFGYLAGVAIERFAAAAVVDPLTRVANRRGLEAHMQREVARAREAVVPLALLVIDVDNMKAINDRHGHAAGDDALHAVAAAIVGSCRTRDVVGRWGGDEFVVLLPRTRAFEAVRVAERIHETLASTAATRVGEQRVSASIGIAEYAGTYRLEPHALFERADRALYRAKEGGRARTDVEPSSEASARHMIRPTPLSSHTQLRAVGADDLAGRRKRASSHDGP